MSRRGVDFEGQLSQSGAALFRQMAELGRLRELVRSAEAATLARNPEVIEPLAGP